MSEIVVETFEQPIEQHPEASEAANRLIEELGLEGQLSRATVNPAARCPYRKWTARECEVYTLLCPCSDPVERYDADPIPLRVLQVLAHAKTLGVYEAFVVRHAASPATKDPVLLGVPAGTKYQPQDWHLLARWGAELDEFPVMERQAADLKRAKMLAQARAAAQKTRGWAERIEATKNSVDLLGMTLPSIWGDLE